MSNHTVSGNDTALPVPPAVAGGESFGATLLGAIGETLLDIVLFIVIVAAAYGFGRGVRAVYRFSIRRAPTSRDLLLGKTVVVVTSTAGLALALSSIYHVDLFSVFATLGIVSLALGFGLQNTVANLAAGVGLTFDRPFDVGDRIRVGETWGDVTTIGLRSTRIRTTSGEHVVVPNALLDTQELWNFTHQDHKHIRLELPVGISYESSYRLAERLMLAAARSTPGILAYPESLVRLRSFGDSAVNLELRVWVDSAPDKAQIQDRLLRRIKDGFDEEGVAIPYPQRTLTYHADLPVPAGTPDDLAVQQQLPAILICTRDARSARAIADTVVSFAVKVEARLVVLVVVPPAQLDTQDAENALDLYLRRARRLGVDATPMLRRGDLAPTLAGVADQVGAGLVVLGRHQGLLTGWVRNEITAVRRASRVPVLLVDGSEPPSEKVVRFWQSQLHKRDEVEGGDATAA